MAPETRKGGRCLIKAFRFILVVVAGVLLGILSFSSYKLMQDSKVHSEARAKDSSVSQSYEVDRLESVPSPRVYEEHVQNQISQGWIKLDDEISPLNSKYDLSQFFRDYPDAIGWIYCPDTPIDYGVVEHEDNDYYLHRFYDGSYSVGGSLFVDCVNARDFSDDNTVIYGHHMNDGTKFARVSYYKDQYYYDEHPVMYISTPSMNYRLELFSAFLTDADSEVYTFNFDSEQSFDAWIRRMQAESDFKNSVQVSAQDHIVTLSTCSYEYYDARYVLLGKLVPIH